MNIKIDENYSLKSDARNVMLVENKVSQGEKNKGEEYDYVLGYYGSVENALKDFKRFQINLSEATTMNELLVEVNKIDKKIEEVLKGI